MDHPEANPPQAPDARQRPLLAGLLRGASRRCPRCGEGAMFAGYVRQAETCSRCGLDIGAYRADDAPPYFTIFAVGHVVIPAMLMLEQRVHPPTWVHMATWLPLTVLLTLGLLPFIKGAVIGAQWALRIKA